MYSIIRMKARKNEIHVSDNHLGSTSGDGERLTATGSAPNIE